MVSFKNTLKFIILLWIVNISSVKSNAMVKKSNKTSILDNIYVCPTVKFVQNSTYLAICRDIIYPNKTEDDVKNANSDKVICMLLFDVTSRICLHNSKHIENDIKFNMPHTAKEFDDELYSLDTAVKDIGTNFVDVLCKNLTSLPSNMEKYNISSDEEIKDYIDIAKSRFLDKECIYTCHKTGGVNPLCIVLLWANKIFTSLKEIQIPDRSVNEKLTNKKDSLITTSSTVETKTIIEQDKKFQETQHNNKEQTVTSSRKDIIHAITSQSIVPSISKDPKTKPLNVEEAHNEEGVSQNTLPHTDKITNLQDVKNSDFNDHLNANKKENDIEEDSEHDNLDDKDGISNEGDYPKLNSADQSDTLENRNPLHTEEDASHFFTYFSIITLLFIALCFGYHNKQKILAMFLEGRRSKRGRGSRRRPDTANYRKLDSNLEEAVTSQCSTNATHIIY